jgi:hypothetical protein
MNSKLIDTLIQAEESGQSTVETSIKINKQSVKVKLTLSVADDDICLDDESFKPADGYFCAYILVKAEALGLEGFDSLGGCELRPNNYFNSQPFQDSIKSYLTDYDMIQNALDSLKSQIESQYLKLKTEAESFKRFSREA